MTVPIWTTEPGFGLPPSTAIPAQSAVRTTISDDDVPMSIEMKPGGGAPTTFAAGAKPRRCFRRNP